MTLADEVQRVLGLATRALAADLRAAWGAAVPVFLGAP